MAIRINRRRLLQGMGLSALATRGYAKQGSAAAYFTHNVASGDPLADRVMLWTRVIPENFEYDVECALAGRARPGIQTCRCGWRGKVPGGARLYRQS